MLEIAEGSNCRSRLDLNFRRDASKGTKIHNPTNPAQQRKPDLTSFTPCSRREINPPLIATSPKFFNTCNPTALTFFRMKLGRKNIVFPHTAGKGHSIFCLRADQRTNPQVLHNRNGQNRHRNQNQSPVKVERAFSIRMVFHPIWGIL